MNIETFAGVVLARNIDVETPDAEISRLAHAKFTDKAFCQLNIIPFDETTTADSIRIRIISKLLKDRVVYVMKYTDVDTLLSDDWSEIATASGWSRDLPLDDWRGCTFENKSLIKLELNGMLPRFWAGPTISSLPESLGTFIRLQALTCIDCDSLTALPATLGNCVQLQKLTCDCCPSLTVLPATLGNCVRLQALNCTGCQSLTELPATLGNCVQLKSLLCNYCVSMTALPETLGNCVQLQELYCNDCKNLTALPVTLGNCAQLQKLRCECCPSLTALPATLGNCVQLEEIRCYGCSPAVESQAEEILVLPHNL